MSYHCLSRIQSSRNLFYSYTNISLCLLTKRNYTIVPTIESGVEVQRIPENRYEEVLNHVTPIMLQDEVLSWSFPPCTTGERERHFRQWALSLLQNGVSLMATDVSNNRVIGASLNRPITRHFLEESVNKLPLIIDPMGREIETLLAKLHLEIDLFKQFNVKELFELGAGCVEKSYRGRGIAKTLLSKSLELAAEAEFQAAKGDCTGVACLKTCMDIGLRPVHEVKYSEYKVNGVVVFGSTGNNPSLTVVAAKLPILPIELMLARTNRYDFCNQ